MVAREMPSGAACVRALLAAGFTMRNRGKGVSVLARNGHIVVVPELAVLPPDIYASILRSAGLDQLDVRPPPSRSGTYARTRPDDPPSSRDP
jgi:hypothetical protein